MSLEDISSSPCVDPRTAWALILGIPAILVVPIVAPALLYGEHLGTVHAAQAEGNAAINQYRAVNLIKSPEDDRAFIISTRPRRSFSRRLVAWEFLGLVAFIAGIVGAGYLGIQLLSRALI